MSKRFTSTKKWTDPWFRKLSPKMKLFWFFITENCDAAGIWNVDLDLASFLIGDTYTQEEVIGAFEGRIVAKTEAYWFIPQFVDFQYGELKEDYNPHRPVIQSLKKHGISRVLQPLLKASPSLMDKGKDKDKDKNIYISNSFSAFWSAYPRKIGKGKAESLWKKIKPDQPLTDTILKAVEAQKNSDQWQKEDGKYIPHPSTWLGQKRWEDETEILKEAPKLKSLKEIA